MLYPEQARFFQGVCRAGGRVITVLDPRRFWRKAANDSPAGIEPMSIRVLVVDDTVVFRRIVSDALAGLPGVEVVGTASNGKLALSRMAALRPDLVTLDIEMPEMNGIEVLEAMGPAGFKAGVIVLSALTMRGGEMTVRALELGAFDFLTKPEGGRAAAEPCGLCASNCADDSRLRAAAGRSARCSTASPSSTRAPP